MSDNLAINEMGTRQEEEESEDEDDERQQCFECLKWCSGQDRDVFEQTDYGYLCDRCYTTLTRECAECNEDKCYNEFETCWDGICHDCLVQSATCRICQGYFPRQQFDDTHCCHKCRRKRKADKDPSVVVITPDKKIKTSSEETTKNEAPLLKTRSCTECGLNGTRISFPKKQWSKNNRLCKDCHNELQSKRQRESETRSCTECGLNGTRISFSKKQWKNEEDRLCKDCHNELQTKRQRERAAQANGQKWHSKHTFDSTKS